MSSNPVLFLRGKEHPDHLIGQEVKIKSIDHNSLHYDNVVGTIETVEPIDNGEVEMKIMFNTWE